MWLHLVVNLLKRETSEKSKSLSLFVPAVVAGLMRDVVLSWKPFQLQNLQHMKPNNAHDGSGTES